jgi:hypothetical protein
MLSYGIKPYEDGAYEEAQEIIDTLHPASGAGVSLPLGWIFWKETVI